MAVRVLLLLLKLWNRGFFSWLQGSFLLDRGTLLLLLLLWSKLLSLLLRRKEDLFGGREFRVEGDAAFLSLLALVAKVALGHDAVTRGVVALSGLAGAASFAAVRESILRRGVE